MTHCFDDKGSKVALFCDQCLSFLPVMETSESVVDDEFLTVSPIYGFVKKTVTYKHILLYVCYILPL